MVGDSGFHRGRAAKRLMNPAEIVVHVEEGHGINVVLDFLRKSIRQPGKPAHSHSHAEVLAFDVGSRDVLGVRGSRNSFRLATEALRWAVAHFLLARSVKFNQLREINVSAKRTFDGF